MVDEIPPTSTSPDSSPVGHVNNVPASTPHAAWRALIIASEVAWVTFAVFVYVMGLNEGSQFEQIVQTIWSYNISQAQGRSRIPYECCNRWLTFDFIFFVLFPALVIAGVLSLLRWLDTNSGVLLLERLKKLFWK
jgi:nitrate reductase NapE component